MFFLLASLIAITIWSYIFLYIIKLEKIGCECALNWRRSFIKYYIIVIILTAILKITSLFDKIPFAIKLLLPFATVAFLIITYQYVNDLKKKKCECSRETARDVLEIVNYIQIGLVVFSVCIGFFLVYSIKSSERKLSKMKLSEL